MHKTSILIKKNVKWFPFTAKTQRTQIKAFLAGFTEGAEGKILFVCPEKSSGQTKRLFWRIGLSPILQKSFSLCDLRVLNESSFEDEWAVRPMTPDEDPSAL